MVKIAEKNVDRYERAIKDFWDADMTKEYIDLHNNRLIKEEIIKELERIHCEIKKAIFRCIKAKEKREAYSSYVSIELKENVKEIVDILEQKQYKVSNGTLNKYEPGMFQIHWD